MSFLLAKDAINGKQGKAILKLNGENHELFHIKKLTADAEFQKADFKVVGTNKVQKRVTGVSYTGSMTVYYGTPYFQQIAKEYNDNGEMLEFEIMLENDDPTAGVGVQRVALYGCTLDRVPICLLDVDSDALEEEIGFSYRDFKYLEEFHDPETLG